MSPNIFVSIASYRDPDCRATLASLFENARFPDRIAVGICWQAVPGEDDDRFPVGPRPDQCRVMTVDARESRGVCWARHQTQSLWQGERYMLQIDSHMRFVADWDEILLAMLDRCVAPKPVISTYPPAFTPPDLLDPPMITTMHAVRFDEHGVLSLDSVGRGLDDAPAAPTPNPFCAGGFFFADSRVLQEVPYDPYLYFHGEEITLAVRLWTHGWDIFSPDRVVLYHDYNNHPGRERHWNDNLDWPVLDQRARKRVRHLLAMDPSEDPDVTIELDRYGLGTERSLESYEAFAEVNFRHRLVKGQDAGALDAAAPPEERRQRHRAIFSDIWRNGSWGCAETRAGSGSTLAATESLRPKLKELFEFLSIRSLLDVGCADLNWIQQISDDLQFYIGIDVIEDVIAQARRKFQDRPNHFFAERDVLTDRLPTVDAVLMRDVLTHLPDRAVLEALQAARASGSRFLIATTHPGGQNDPITMGGWRPMDLCAAPFSLPPPRILLREELPGSAKALGVWQMTALPADERRVAE